MGMWHDLIYFIFFASQKNMAKNKYIFEFLHSSDGLNCETVLGSKGKLLLQREIS